MFLENNSLDTNIRNRISNNNELNLPLNMPLSNNNNNILEDKPPDYMELFPSNVNNQSTKLEDPVVVTLTQSNQEESERISSASQLGQNLDSPLQNVANTVPITAQTNVDNSNNNNTNDHQTSV